MGVKIKVEFEGNTDKLSSDIQRATAKGFRGGLKEGLVNDPELVARNIMGNLWQVMKGHKDTSGLIIPPSVSLDQAITPPPVIKAFQASMRLQAQQRSQQAQFLKNIGFAGIPLLNPTSVFGNLFASRQIFSGLTGPVGQGILGKVGLGGSTAGAAAATGIVMVAILAVATALKALQETIKGTIKAYEEARKLYARTLLSGLGLTYTIGRKNLSDILGVSEKEVNQFGAAIGMVGPKLRFATDIMAKTTPNLASVSYEFKILGKDLEALFFTLANDLAPALRIFADGISKLLVAFTRFLEHDPIGKLLKQLTIGVISDAAGAIGKMLGGTDIGAAPTPQGMMKQLPASHLERMGLVVGGFGVGSDFAQRTAKATEKSSKLLEKIAIAVSGSASGSFADPYMNSP